MLAQEAQVLAGPRPAEHAEGRLLRGRYDHVHAPHLARIGPKVAEDVVVPAGQRESVSKMVSGFEFYSDAAGVTGL